MLFLVEAGINVAWVALIQYIVKKDGQVAKEAKIYSVATRVFAHINKNFRQWWTNAVPPLG